MTNEELLERIRKEIIDSGRDSRYKLAAYNFILKGLEFNLVKIGEKRHVSGQELCKALAIFAATQFGPFAMHLLRYWGITSTKDFGYIVYNLIELGVLKQKSEDKLEDFFGVLDLKKFFAGRNLYAIDKNYIRRIQGA